MPCTPVHMIIIWYGFRRRMLDVNIEWTIAYTAGVYSQYAKSKVSIVVGRKVDQVAKSIFLRQVNAKLRVCVSYISQNKIENSADTIISWKIKFTCAHSIDGSSFTLAFCGAASQREMPFTTFLRAKNHFANVFIRHDSCAYLMRYNIYLDLMPSRRCRRRRDECVCVSFIVMEESSGAGYIILFRHLNLMTSKS